LKKILLLFYEAFGRGAEEVKIFFFEETKKVQNLLKNDRTNASHGDIVIIIVVVIIVREGRFVVYS
jgi:hypothetical protein